MQTLDGLRRNRDMLPCDDSGPVALAGVMGGAATEVSERPAYSAGVGQFLLY